MLIVVDTLRRDHLGCYGESRPLSPAIDALARESVRFDRAYTTAPWTQPAVASMLTGLYPSGHGLHRVARLPDTLETLPEILRERGYTTAGVVSHLLLMRRYNDLLDSEVHLSQFTSAQADVVQYVIRQVRK